jgi:steroid delta-isomerase-like uncharacterized protein
VTAKFVIALSGLAMLGAAGQSDSQPVVALRQMVDAVNAGDAPGYARLYAPNSVITIHGSLIIRGVEAIERHEVELLREFPGARLGFYNIWQKGPLAIVRYAVNGETRGRQRMGHEGLLFFRFDDAGRIVEENRYLDSLTPMAQMGALGSVATRPLPLVPRDPQITPANDSTVETKNITIVREHLGAFSAKSATVYLSSLSDDIYVDEIMFPQPYIGRADVQRWVEAWFRAVPDAQLEIKTLVGVQDFVLAETVLRGTLQGTLGAISASNKSFAVHRGMILEVRGARISRIAAFMNGKELAEAVGQWPPPRK